MTLRGVSDPLTNAMDSARFKSPGRAAAADKEATGIFRRPSGIGSPGRDRREAPRGVEAPRSVENLPRRTAAETDDGSEVHLASLRDSLHGKLTYDAKGNPVWEWRENRPRRRHDDSTVDMLKCLDSGALTLAEDPDEDRGGGVNPYDTAGDRARK
jgi:hypothetical protein